MHERWEGAWLRRRRTSWNCPGRNRTCDTRFGRCRAPPSPTEYASGLAVFG